MHRMDKRIDIILPFFGEFEYLERFIDSVRKYTECDYKIYIFNNGSNKDFNIENKDIKIIFSERNIGFASALNRLIRISNSPYILVTNADIWFYEDIITKLLDLLDCSSFIGIAPQVLSEDGKIQRTAGSVFPNIFNIFIEFFRIYERFRFLPFNLSYIYNLNSHKKNQVVSHLENCFVIYKRDAFERYGLFDEKFTLYFEDIEFQRRFFGKEKLYYCKDLKVYHKCKVVSILKGREFYVKSNRIRNRSLLLYFKKYRNPIEFIILHNFLKIFYGKNFLGVDKAEL